MTKFFITLLYAVTRRSSASITFKNMKKTSILFLALAAIFLFSAGYISRDYVSRDTEKLNKALNQPQKRSNSVEDQSPIKIGWVGPLTGDVAYLGQDSVKSAQLAVEEVNTAGGVNGRSLELIIEDGKCSPKDGALAANKLINIDNVPVILGGQCSGELLAMAPIAEEKKVVLISGCSSAPTVTNAGDYTFRTYPSDAFRGVFTADYLANTIGKKKVALLADLGDWGQGNKNSLSGRFQELNGQIVVSEDFVQESRDFRTSIAKIKNSDAEAVLFYGYTEASLAFLKQAEELGLNVPLIGGDTWGDAEIHKNSFAEGIRYPDIVTNFSSAWKKKMEERGIPFSICTPKNYDNAKIIAEIMNRVGLDSEKIKNELYKVKDYPGVNGVITIDKNGDLASAEYDMLIVKNGKAEVENE